MRGRKPTPTELKLVTGNPGHRPLNPREPKTANSMPTCPAHLSPTAKAEWKRLAGEMHRLGIVSQLEPRRASPPNAPPKPSAAIGASKACIGSST